MCSGKIIHYCFFWKSKENQTGERSDVPWHVYSNPLNPFLCPVLSLAKYIISHPGLLNGQDKLFPGSNQYERFIKVFHKAISDNEDTFQGLGVEEGSLGSHSCRKGDITFLSSGCTVSPPMASICLRAFWSMGPVKGRYIHYEKSGDQFVGRAFTGISLLTKEFGISPSHSNFHNSPEGTKEGVKEVIVNNLVKKRSPKHNICSNTIFVCKNLLSL